MRRIVVRTRGSGTRSQLISLLQELFPECEVVVLPADRITEDSNRPPMQVQKEKWHGEHSAD